MLQKCLADLFLVHNDFREPNALFSLFSGLNVSNIDKPFQGVAPAINGLNGTTNGNHAATNGSSLPLHVKA